MQELSVRVAVPGDLAELDALFARSYARLLKPDYPPSVLVTALPLISRANPALLRSGTYYVAEQAGRIVGAGGWTSRRQSGLADIRHFVTDAGLVRQGIGRAILSRVIAEAGAAGIAMLLVQATRTAVPFYAALGFEPHGGEVVIELRAGIDFPVVQMQRRL